MNGPEGAGQGGAADAESTAGEDVSGRGSGGELRRIRGLSFGQVVLVADEVCAATGASVRDYPGLAALAGATAPRLAGVPVHADGDAQARAVAALTRRIAPLTPTRSANEVLAAVLVDVLAARNERPVG